jgi:hypothetical protein
MPDNEWNRTGFNVDIEGYSGGVRQKTRRDVDLRTGAGHRSGAGPQLFTKNNQYSVGLFSSYPVIHSDDYDHDDLYIDPLDAGTGRAILRKSHAGSSPRERKEHVEGAAHEVSV